MDDAFLKVETSNFEINLDLLLRSLFLFYKIITNFDI